MDRWLVKVVLLGVLLCLGALGATAAPPDPELVTADLGVPDGDCFQVLDIAADPQGSLIYALCARGDGGAARPAVVALDARSGKRLATASLPGADTSAQQPTGRLALDPVAARLYVLCGGLDALVVLDADGLDEVGRLPDVQQVVAAPGSGRFFVLTETELAVHAADDLAAQSALTAHATTAGVVLGYHAAADHLYLANGASAFSVESGDGMRVYRGATLTLEATLPVTRVQALAADGRANRLYVLTNDGQMLAVDGATHAITVRNLEPPAAQSFAQRLLADETTGDVYLIGEQFGSGFWLIADGETLETRRLYEGFLPWEATALAPGRDTPRPGRDTLLAVRRGGEVVMSYNPANGPPAATKIQPGCSVPPCRQADDGRLVLGRRVLAAAVWKATGWLYAVDSSGRLHAMEGTRLEVFVDLPALFGATHPGMTSPDEISLAVDERLARLFIADRVSGRTYVIGLDTLEPAGTLDAAGSLAVDAERGHLFVADGDVTTYDTSTLEPAGSLPGKPAITFARVHSADAQVSAEDVVFEDGRLFVRLYVRQSGPASRNLAFYREYDPTTLAPLGDFRLPLGTYQQQPVIPLGSSHVWIPYGGGGSCPQSQGPVHSDCRQGLALYADDHMELGQIRGLTGHLWSDGDHLYLQRERDVLALDAAWGDPSNALTLGMETWSSTLDGDRGWLYLWGWDRMAALPTAQLLAQTETALPFEEQSFIHSSPQVETDHTLFAAIPATGVYRSTDDGRTWQVASRGIQRYSLQDLAFSPDWAVDRTLVVTVGCETAFRSTDGGDTWSLDGRPRLAFVSDRSGNKEIYTMRYDPDAASLPAQAQQITDHRAADDNPAWSPDGTRLVFQSDRSGNQDLWVMNWDGGNLMPLTTHLADDVLPAWSPDGGRIAFTSLRDGNPEIYLIGAPPAGSPGDEATVLRLTDHPADDWRPAWSPDGRQIAFVSTRDGDNDIFVLSVPPTTGDLLQDPIRITRNDADDRDPAWMPSGDILFLSDAGTPGSFEICRVKPDGIGPGCLTDSPFDKRHVVAVDASGRILYVTEETGNADIFFMEIAGRYVQRLTEDPSAESAPAWSPVLTTLPVLPTPTPTFVPPPTPTAGPSPTPVIRETVASLPRPKISAGNAPLVAELEHWRASGVWCAAFSPDGRLLALGADGGCHLHPYGARLVSAARDGTVYAWGIVAEKETR